MPCRRPRLRPSMLGSLVLGALVAVVGTGAVGPSLDARQAVPAGMCRIEGKAVSAGTPLPGVSVVLKAGESTAFATSSELDGRYRLAVKPGTYQVTVELAGFTPVTRDVVIGGESCGQTIDFDLALTRRTAAPVGAAARPAAAPGQGRGTSLTQRFEAIAVREQAAAGVAEASADRDAEETAARQLLPPGFSTDAPAQ